MTMDVLASVRAIISTLDRNKGCEEKNRKTREQIGTERKKRTKRKPYKGK